MAGRAAEATPLKGGRLYALSSGMMTEKTLSNIFARQVLSDPQHALFFVGYADPDSPAGRLRRAAPGDIVQLSPDDPSAAAHLPGRAIQLQRATPRAKACAPTSTRCARRRSSSSTAIRPPSSGSARPCKPTSPAPK